jgi:hypothetical protein
MLTLKQSPQRRMGRRNEKITDRICFFVVCVVGSDDCAFGI